ncbi:MAG: methylisocitrate lyase [Nitrospiraceae bacterium]|nr:methylisocitrate lyase [Nitrospiraceae bacterium]
MPLKQPIGRARRLRELIEKQTVAMPGAFNALTALQIERAGFQGVYVSGAGLSASRGLPDIGLLSLTEVAADAAAIAGVVAIPAIVDADTGFGPPLSVARAVRLFEQADLAGMQIEDQELPKKCGHLPGKRLVETGEMTSKIRAACDARRDRDFVIIARTDARAVGGLEEAVHRAKAYVDAGADAIFPEALESADEFRSFARRLTGKGGTLPLVANMTEYGKTPYLSLSEFEDLGYRVVLFPVTALRVATHAVEQALQELKILGTQHGFVDRMQTRQQLYDLLRYDAFGERDLHYQSEDRHHADH